MAVTDSCSISSFSSILLRLTTGTTEEEEEEGAGEAERSLVWLRRRDLKGTNEWCSEYKSVLNSLK